MALSSVFLWDMLSRVDHEDNELRRTEAEIRTQTSLGLAGWLGWFLFCWFLSAAGWFFMSPRYSRGN